jgi:hypothetical protein
LGAAGKTRVSVFQFVVLAFSAQWSAAAAAEPGANACVSALSAAERHAVAEVKDGETLVLANGTAVRLIGAKAGRPPHSPSEPISPGRSLPLPQRLCARWLKAPRSSFVTAAAVATGTDAFWLMSLS